MESKLEELLNNYNYLLEAVKNSQITPDDAVKTLDSLSVIDNTGRIWKMNLYGEFVSGFPGGDLEKSDPLTFNNSLDNQINYSIPPTESRYDEVIYNPTGKIKRKKERKKERKKIDISNFKKTRTPIIIIVSLVIAFYFYNSSNNKNIESGSLDNKSQGVEGEEISLANKNDLSQKEELETLSDNTVKVDDTDYVNNKGDSGEKTVGSRQNYKKIESIFTNISKSKTLAFFRNENESVEQLYLKRAQIEGYIAVGLKIKVDKIVNNNEKHYYYLKIFLNNKVLIIGEGEIYNYNEKLENIELSWPEFKRAS